VSAVVRELEKVPRAALYAAYLITPDDHLRDLLSKYAAYLAAIEPETTGDDLRAMGLKPSPAFGRILTALRDAWLDGKVENPEQEQAMLADLLAAETSADPDA
jgi:tRNA nucleotidyltransferase (CCA-adding enzyme)